MGVGWGKEADETAWKIVSEVDMWTTRIIKEAKPCTQI